MKWIGQQIDWLKSIFSEPDKKGSIKRVIMGFVTATFVSSYTKVSIATETLLDIPMNWMIILAGMIGLGIVDKYVKNGK